MTFPPVAIFSLGASGLNTQSEMSPVEAAPLGSGHRKPNMTNDQRVAAYHMLLGKQKPGAPGKLVRGAIKEVASVFHVTSDTISDLWVRAQSSLV